MGVDITTDSDTMDNWTVSVQVQGPPLKDKWENRWQMPICPNKFVVRGEGDANGMKIFIFEVMVAHGSVAML